MNRANKHQLKLAVLEVVKSKKQILFASLQNSTVTKSDKEEAWREVLVTAQSLGIAKDKHDWIYARDNLFGLWKSRTLAKRDNIRKRGTRCASKFDVVDKMIIEIIEADSTKIAVDPGLTVQAEHDSLLNRLRKHTNDYVQKRKLPTNDSDDESEMNRLQKELLRIEIYKNKLKILKLETDLGLQPSEYTECIVKTNTTNFTIKYEQ